MLAAVSLFFGICCALFIGEKLRPFAQKYSPLLLGLSITGLGASLNLIEVLKVGLQGFVMTLASIVSTIFLALFIGRWLKIQKNVVLLLAAGTAICGGSAIAAASSALKANEDETSISLAIVFILNLVALLLFPYLGHLFSLTEAQFGLWSAIAIHDTSSVVGANLSYGPMALQLATTVKLARALWIAPVTILLLKLSEKWDSREATQDTKLKSNIKFKIPWFIWGFLGMACLATFAPTLFGSHDLYTTVSNSAKKLFILVLFLIGCQINFKSVKKIGPKPFVLALILWLFISLSSFFMII